MREGVPVSVSSVLLSALVVLVLLILFLIYGGFNFWHWFASAT